MFSGCLQWPIKKDVTDYKMYHYCTSRNKKYRYLKYDSVLLLNKLLLLLKETFLNDLDSLLKMSLHCTYAYVCVCVWNKLKHSKSFFTFRIQPIEPPCKGKSWKFYEFCHNTLHWVIKSKDKRGFHYYPQDFLPAIWNQELTRGKITLPIEGHTASKWCDHLR